MMRKSLVFFTVALLASLVSAGLSADPASSERRNAVMAAAIRLPAGAFAAMETIIPDHIRQHVRFPSHDLLEGRGTGQRGGDIAAEYIATQFALYGLKPAGDNGSYMQKVPLVGITPSPETRVWFVPAQGSAMELKPLDDYVAYDETQQSQSDVDADMVYVGYGIEAPEYNWDDYKGTDVKGKVLLMLVNEPSDDPKIFKGPALTYYGRWTYKYEEAARKGAVGAILIHKTDMASYGWEVVRNSNSGEKSYLRREGQPKLNVSSWIQLGVAQKLVASAGMDLDKMMADAQ